VRKLGFQKRIEVIIMSYELIKKLVDDANDSFNNNFMGNSNDKKPVNNKKSIKNEIVISAYRAIQGMAKDIENSYEPFKNNYTFEEYVNLLTAEVIDKLKKEKNLDGEIKLVETDKNNYVKYGGLYANPFIGRISDRINEKSKEMPYDSYRKEIEMMINKLNKITK